MIKIIYFTIIAIFTSTCFANTKITDIHEIEHLISSGNVQIGGSLTLPKARKIKQLVIMISGSGPQDRDETLDGFKVFKELSTLLGEQGIATFRFDDRGVGDSTGNFPSTTLVEHANDVRAIIEYFKTNEQFKFTDFILFGHSQGGIVAANVAVENKHVNKIVLMGAPSVPLIDIVLYQVRLEYANTNLNKALIEAEVSSHNKLMYSIKNDKNIKHALREFETSTKSILNSTNSMKKLSSEQIDSMAESKSKEFKIVYALPSLTSFLYHDTANDYEKLNVPVLALFGGKDLQVTIEQNKDRMERALLNSNTSFHFRTFDNANHYFQKAKTGLREEYGTLDRMFVDGFADYISSWLLEN